MTVSYTESCLIWNVPNGAFPHLASSIHQPTILSGIVILAIDKCTTDAKKKIKINQSLHRGSTAATAEVKTKPANSHKPLSVIWLPPPASPSREWARGRGRTSKWLRIQTLHRSKLLFLIRGFQNDTFRSVQMLLSPLALFFSNDTGLFPTHALLSGDKQHYQQG